MTASPARCWPRPLRRDCLHVDGPITCQSLESSISVGWKATNRELMDKNSGLTQILQLDTWALVSPEYLQSSPQSSLQESLQHPPPPSVPPLLTSFHPFLPARLTDSISPLTPAESLLPSSLCLTPPYSYWPNKQVSPVNTLTSVRTHKPLSERKRQCECV